MDEHFPVAALDLVPLELRDVVTNVVDDPQFGLLPENAFESSARKMRDALAVRPGKICGGAHRGEVSLAFARVRGHRRQLPVRQRDCIALHALIHVAQVIGADLVAEPARARVDEHHDFVLVKPQPFGDPGVEDPLDVLDFEEVIAGAEGSRLRQPPGLCTVAHGRRVGALEAPVFLHRLEVLHIPVAVRHHPGGAFGEHFVELLVREPDVALAACTRWDVAEQLVDEFTRFGADFLDGQGAREQAHAAVDVESHAARRDHAAFVG